MKLKSSEKREGKRAPLQIVMRYTMQKKSKKGYMTNLSEGGCLMYCYSPAPVQVNKPVKISFYLKNSLDNISVKSKVVRVTPFIRNTYDRYTEDINYMLGIQFLSLNQSHKEAIENYTRKVLNAIKQE